MDHGTFGSARLPQAPAKVWTVTSFAYSLVAAVMPTSEVGDSPTTHIVSALLSVSECIELEDPWLAHPSPYTPHDNNLLSLCQAHGFARTPSALLY